MKKIFFVLTIFTLTSFVSYLTNIATAQTKVGHLQNGVPTLNMDDATLSNTFSSILDGAILSDAQIKSSKDELGTFYYVSAKGKTKKGTTANVAIVLEETGGTLVYLVSSGCTMICNSGSNCSSCEHNIIVRCKSQRCTCLQGSGSCDSIIRFSDDK